MYIRLDQEAPGLGDRLESIAGDARRTIVTQACAVVAENFQDWDGVLQSLVGSLRKPRALDRNLAASTRLLAETADNRYFALKEENAPEAEWTLWFRRARLLTAISIALGEMSPKETADAVYELCHATENSSQIVSLIKSLIEKNN